MNSRFFGTLEEFGFVGFKQRLSGSQRRKLFGWQRQKKSPDKRYGTASSGNYGHKGRPGEVGGAGEGGASQPDVMKMIQSKPPTVRSSDGKNLTTTIPGAIVTRGIAGREFVDPVSIGKYLLNIQATHRGETIYSGKKILEGRELDYMVDGLVSQYKTATERGIVPEFYTSKERLKQLAIYSEVQPLMRGGVTASGLDLGTAGKDGFSENAAWLYSAVQAFTSVRSTPESNLTQTDKVLEGYLNNPNVKVLGEGIVFPGPAGAGTSKGLRRLDTIIKAIGIDATRVLFSNPDVRAGDVAKMLEKAVPGMKGFMASGHAVNERVPLFAAFGPKVGPFFSNNTGHYDVLTADVWFTRTWGRLSGELLVAKNDKTALGHGKRLESAMSHVTKETLGALQTSRGDFEKAVRDYAAGKRSELVEQWAEVTFKQTKKDKYPSIKKGDDKNRVELDSVSKLIVKNVLHPMEAPANTTMRLNMGVAMRLASKRTGVSVAFMQDAIWQDEQDIYGSLGIRTTTKVGVPSRYSDVLRRLVDAKKNPKSKANPKRRKKLAKAGARSMDEFGYDDSDFDTTTWTPTELDQLLFDDEMDDVTDEQFLKAILELKKMLDRRSKSKNDNRAFCPTGKDNGIDNSCGKEGGGGGGVDKSESGRPQSDFPKSFPSEAKKFRDAIDATAPDGSKKVWDRAQGLATTPSKDVVDRIAREHNEMPNEKPTPETESAYASLVDHLGKQYESLLESGLQVREWSSKGEPYGDPPGSTKPNSDKMRSEVGRTGEFNFFTTKQGFGTGDSTPNHPMLRETKYKTADGKPIIANDLFRVVHDMVAHVRGGYSFSTNGEFNGMLTHASTLPRAAWPALFAETFSQNAVYESTGRFARQTAFASQTGAQMIDDELNRQNDKDKKGKRAENKTQDDSDEPLGFQHIKSRPWLAKELKKTSDGRKAE